MVIKKHFHIITSLFLFIGVLWTGQVFGFWQLKSDEIGGDTLIVEVSNKYGIPLESIYDTWNIPDHISPRAELAEARDEAGFSMGRFKIWVTAFVKENYELAEVGQTKIDEDDFNITGAITLQELSYYFGIPRVEINRKFSLPDSLPPDTTVRELRESYDVEMGDIKIWLQIFSDGLPYYSAVKAGERLDPNHIRDWMTLEQVSQATGIPLNYIYIQTNLYPHIEAADLTLGELKGHGFATEDIRNMIKEYYQLNPDIQPITPQITPSAGTPSDTGGGKNRRP